MASSAPRGLRSDHVVTVGIALFSMLFGAGNLIIPPLLALQAGSATPVAMLGFLIAAIGLPVMGFIAVALAGTARELAGRVHPKFGEFFVAAVYLAIGPCLAIPRTSSTAFEMLVPLLPEGVSLGTARLVFAVGFFVVAFALTLRPGVITRVLGRITGPALIALIVLVVGAAVISPLGPAAAPQAPYDAGAAVQGFLTGYQTMDLLASLAFGIIIAETIHELGVTNDKRVAFEISRSGVIAGVLMAIIYCGLALAGMQLGTVMPDATNGAAILARSASMHFGLAGTVVVFAIFFLACMNVCIGLISCCSRYFCETYVIEGGSGGLRGGHAPPLRDSRLCVRGVFVRTLQRGPRRDPYVLGAHAQRLVSRCHRAGAYGPGARFLRRASAGVGLGRRRCRGAERDYLGSRRVLCGCVAAVRCAAAGGHWSRVGAGCRGGVCDRSAPQQVCRTFEELGFLRLHRRGVSPIISFALGHARFRP